MFYIKVIYALKNSNMGNIRSYIKGTRYDNMRSLNGLYYLLIS